MKYNLNEIKFKYIVYHFLDENNNLLYIGSTTNIVSRIKDHFRIKKMKEVRKIVVYEMAACPDMLFFEAQGIVVNKPNWNSKLIEGVKSEYNIEPISFIEINLELL